MRTQEGVPALRRAAIAFIPVLCLALFLWMVGTNRLQMTWLTINGNRYAANVVLAVTTVLSQLIVFVNLCFYLSDVRATRGVATDAKEALWSLGGAVSKWPYRVLVGAWGTIFLYFGIALMTLFGGGRDGLWLFSLEAFSLLARIVTLGFFGAFLIVDVAVRNSWEAELQLLSGRSSRSGDERRAVNLRDLAEYSIYLIDLPAIVVTLASWIAVFGLEHSRYIRNMLEVDYVSGQAWSAMSLADAELFIHGIDTGVIVATMLLSQWIFAWLMWKCRGTDVKVEVPRPALGASPRQA
jgi:hypothetical protein